VLLLSKEYTFKRCVLSDQMNNACVFVSALLIIVKALGHFTITHYIGIFAGWVI
jgi:hypothetical protein